MSYAYDLFKIKDSLTQDQVFQFLTDFHGEPYIRNDIIISKTICHNNFDNLNNASHKLYYYSNTQLFHCYTGCANSSFDIFELLQKIKTMETGREWSLAESINFIANYFGFSSDFIEEEELPQDFELFNRYDRIKNIDINTQEVELKEYEDNFLKNLPHPKIQPWIDEGISEEVMQDAEICYDPKNQGIVIPHRDINNRLIGIRERTLIQEQAELYGKYLPARLGGKMYNHPLSFSVYNLNRSKKNIQKIKKAIIFESEKSCLKYRSFFGIENDISCAVCGSNFIKYQFWLIHSLGAEEIIIGFDRQYKEIGDEEYYRWVKKLKEIAKKYSIYCDITFLFDTKNLLEYKDAPVDKGPKIFLQLFKERLNKDGKTR